MSDFFGYSISPSATIKIDGSRDERFELLQKAEPDVKICMACGSCAGSCTAGDYADMNLRRVILLLQRGKHNLALSQLSRCMLCGKCTLVCPRAINTRRLILKIQEIYGEAHK